MDVAGLCRGAEAAARGKGGDPQGGGERAAAKIGAPREEDGASDAVRACAARKSGRRCREEGGTAAVPGSPGGGWAPDVAGPLRPGTGATVPGRRRGTVAGPSGPGRRWDLGIGLRGDAREEVGTAAVPGNPGGGWAPDVDRAFAARNGGDDAREEVGIAAILGPQGGGGGLRESWRGRAREEERPRRADQATREEGGLPDCVGPFGSEEGAALPREEDGHCRNRRGPGRRTDPWRNLTCRRRPRGRSRRCRGARCRGRPVHGR